MLGVLLVYMILQYSTWYNNYILMRIAKCKQFPDALHSGYNISANLSHGMF